MNILFDYQNITMNNEMMNSAKDCKAQNVQRLGFFSHKNSVLHCNIALQRKSWMVDSFSLQKYPM